MRLRMWSYDIAREQAPTLEHLLRFLEATEAGGYNAIGLYLEHRFAYPSAPWAQGAGAVTPAMVREAQARFPDIQIIPFVNLLGHYEGMLYTESGKRYAEERFRGMQACPSNPEFVRLARQLLEDVFEAFSSEIIHIGGDETWQLGRCGLCSQRVEEAAGQGLDGKAVLYGNHFGPLARHVLAHGRRPAVWGDMFLDHPAALDEMPNETLIFDWQYFKSPLETSRQFQEKGFEVVCCPTIFTYNAAWCHLAQSEENIRDAVKAATDLDAFGVCVTTWECGLMGNYETILPAVRAAGLLLDSEAANRPETLLAAYANVSAEHALWAELMAVELAQVGGCFEFSGTRSSLKARLLLYSNPFLAWLYHHEELCGEVGTRALEIVDRAVSVAPDGATRGVCQFVQGAIEFVRFADQARQAYAQGLPGVAIASLSPCRQIFEDMERFARATHLNIGGSRADIERCRIAREHVERVIRRIKEFGDGSLGYLPAFEILSHPKFVPHDQASWWLINSWANE